MKHFAILSIVILLFITPALAGIAINAVGDFTEINDNKHSIISFNEPEASQECADANGKLWLCGKATIKVSFALAEGNNIARSQNLGIWQGKEQPDKEYRVAKGDSAEQVSPKDCIIKGNISRNGRIYHVPWSRWYNRTRINTSKGERWFCTEAEAVAAGWRAPRR